MRYVVSLSGGIASAVAADRAIERYGRENVILWFADTSWEDEDLYRFLGDCMERWGDVLITHRDGRTPLQVAEDVKLIPNQKRAPCSRVLKQEPFLAFLRTIPKPCTVLLGLDWREMHRHQRPKEAYEAVEGVTVDFPLLWPPLTDQYATIVESWGVRIPRLYTMGFPHNNCGGRCVRQGRAEWLRLRGTMPERFEEVRDWEEEQRAKGGARAKYAIQRDRRGGEYKPMTLAQLEAEFGGDPHKIEIVEMPDDRFGCFCEL